MSDKTKVSASELKDLAGKIDTVTGEIQGVMSKLDGIAVEMQSHWSGSAALAYQGLQQQVNDDGKALNRILGDIRDALAASGTDFGSQEEDQKHILEQLKGSTADDSILKAFG
jgi:WXG100 family type VII secretion target